MIKVVIFDMDGVISETQKLHAQVESEILKRVCIELSPEEITRRYAGVRPRDFFEQLLKEKGKENLVDALVDEKWKRVTEAAFIAVDEIDGSVDLIKYLHENKFPLAVVSGANREFVNAVLKSLELEKYFKFILGGDEVKNGKPHPEGFLLAAKNLETAPEECLVIEDGIAGMQAAKVGGMKCIGLVTFKADHYPTKNLVNSLREISLDYLNALR